MINRALVILNPGSSSASLEMLEHGLEKHGGTIEWRVRLLKEGEDAEQATSEEIGRGWEVVVAAGGDGTVSGVARSAARAGIPMAIAPMGTANMLADQLGIPADIDGAVGLLAGEAAVRRIDGMEIGGRLYFLAAGVGVSASTIRDLSDVDKRRLGFSAYVWTGIASSLSFRPVACTISIDGHRRRLRIRDVSVINAGFRREWPVPGVPDIRPDDGRLDVLIIWAPKPRDYFRHLGRALFKARPLEPGIQWRGVEREVRIECRKGLPVQADGDLVAETPVTIRLVRDAVGVVVPPGSTPAGP
jgi:diacylglycerol kinase (ATP)